MADRHGLAQANVADELRSIIAGRLRRRHRLKRLALVGLAAAPLLASLVWKPPVLLVWNASASAPVGLYSVQPGAAVRRGDMVIAWTPAGARSLAAARHYLPANVPLVKRIHAAKGDRVCAKGSALTINGKPAVTRLARDFAGRPLPWWSGCLTLGPQDYLLLMESGASFDGRYFGPTRASDLVGRAVPLWAKPAAGSSDA